MVTYQDFLEVFYFLICGFFVLVLQVSLMADQLIISLCCFLTGSVLLYPFPLVKDKDFERNIL